MHLVQAEVATNGSLCAEPLAPVFCEPISLERELQGGVFCLSLKDGPCADTETGEIATLRGQIAATEVANKDNQVVPPRLRLLNLPNS